VYGFSGYVLWAVQRVRTEAQEKQYRGIREAIEAGDVTALSRMLLETPPDTPVGGGRTLLMVAIEEANLPAIELMIARGATLERRDERGMTALGLAAEMGFREALEVLVAAGADPNVPDNAGLTALDIAEEHGSHDLAAILLKAGAKPGREIAPPAP